MSEDPRWADSQPRLVERIRDEILAAPGERITFARFMQRALTEPGLGYYASSDRRPTRTGDFLTAPELHPFFGRCIGRFITAAWSAVGSPETFRVDEYGAGRGALRDSASVDLASVLRWRRIDLPDRSDAAAGNADLVLANEYLDALPVHRMIQGDTLSEVYVAWIDGWFDEAIGEPSTSQLGDVLAADGVELREGQRAEICLVVSGWLTEVRASLAEGGVLLVIDYGQDAAELYGPRHMAGSLLTYRQHGVSDDPFVAVGHTDITAHVDLTNLERCATAAGLVPVGSTTQGRFLASLGLGELLSDLGRQPDVAAPDYLEARAAVGRLMDPRHLGAFRVLAFARPRAGGSVPSLPGFELEA